MFDVSVNIAMESSIFKLSIANLSAASHHQPRTNETLQNSYSSSPSWQIFVGCLIAHFKSKLNQSQPYIFLDCITKTFGNAIWHVNTETRETQIKQKYICGVIYMYNTMPWVVFVEPRSSGIFSFGCLFLLFHIHVTFSFSSSFHFPPQ